MFFSFDGIDGTGKSTQMRLFCDVLRAHGLPFVACRDPGSTKLGELIREILLASDASTPISRRSEMLLYMAARAQLVDEVIRPALETESIVVCDRFLMANVVYQGHAGGLEPAAIRAVGEAATGGVMPDCVFMLDLSPEAAAARIDRPLDRMERQGAEYVRRLREGFLAEATIAPEQVHVIDANQTIEVVHAQIVRVAGQLLNRQLGGA